MSVVSHEEPEEQPSQGNATSEYVIGYEESSERFRCAINAMMTRFRLDLSSEDFLSRRILELSESAPSIDQFFRESIAFMDRHLTEHRRQTETLRASLRTMQAFFTSFNANNVDAHQRQPSSELTQDPSAPLTASGNTMTNSSSLPGAGRSPDVLGSPFVFLTDAQARRHMRQDSHSTTTLHTLTHTREDVSMDVLQYFEGPLVSTPPSTPAPNKRDRPGNSNNNLPSTSSTGDRSHPFVLRQIIRRHHLIRTPDGRVNVPGAVMPSTVRVRFRSASAETTPYPTPRRSTRRSALAKSKGKGKRPARNCIVFSDDEDD